MKMMGQDQVKNKRKGPPAKKIYITTSQENKLYQIPTHYLTIVPIIFSSSSLANRNGRCNKKEKRI